MMWRWIHINKYNGINWNASPSKVYQTIKEFSESDKLFVRNHKQEILNHVNNLLQTSKWWNLVQITRLTDINQFDSWSLLRGTGKQINNKINKLQVNKLSLLQLGFLLQFMNKLNYEITNKGENNNEDNNKIFYHKILNKIQQLISNKKYKDVINILCNLFILPQQKLINIQQHMKLQINSTTNINKKYFATFRKGLYQQIWSQSFIQYMYQTAIKYQIKSLSSIIQIVKPTIFPTSCCPLIKQSYTQQSISQNRIDEILKQMDYNYQRAVLINSYLEVDFILGERMILEFNGLHHYNISCKKPQHTVHENWRNTVLLNRGFTICQIPFYQWKSLGTLLDRKQYLISKIEKSYNQCIRKQNC